MPMEKKKKTQEEKDFNKSWGKKCKLRADSRSVSKDVGKAPKCNTRVKTPKVAESVNQKNKKKK